MEGTLWKSKEKVQVVELSVGGGKEDLPIHARGFRDGKTRYEVWLPPPDFYLLGPNASKSSI